MTRPPILPIVALLLASSFYAQAPADPMARGFANPPNASRLRLWRHWMNGNITQPGIKLDLGWMHRAGLEADIASSPGWSATGASSAPSESEPANNPT
jgi:hypothetical protein